MHQTESLSRVIGRGVPWVRLAPLARHQGLLNLRWRVKMNLRIARNVDFNNLIFQNFPGNYTPGTLLDAHASGASDGKYHQFWSTI